MFAKMNAREQSINRFQDLKSQWLKFLSKQKIVAIKIFSKYPTLTLFSKVCKILRAKRLAKILMFLKQLFDKSLTRSINFSSETFMRIV